MTLHSPVLDTSLTYDLVESLLVLGGRMPPGRWRSWKGQIRASLGAPAYRRLRQWFGGPAPVGGASVALIPLLPKPHDTDGLFTALSALSQSDFLRLAVTAGFIDPEAPLTSDDLLSLREVPAEARAYVERYLRLTGSAQTHLLWILAEPEAAREELLEIMGRHLTGPFAEIEPAIHDEHGRAAQRLKELLSGDDAEEPLWLRRLRERRGFSPVVAAPSAFVPRSTAYYHEIRQPLFDGTDYEPYILVVNNQLVLDGARPGRPAADMSPHSHQTSPRELVERSAMLFGLLADPTRLRMLRLLATRPHYGQELASALGISGATTTHHTNELIRSGFVSIERRAHRTYFVLRTESLSHELRESLDFLLAGNHPAIADEGAGTDELHDEKESAL